jgi:ABC-2 type transport system permease protein
MFKLATTIKKDLRILTRDKVGLIFMFAMPIVLAIVITAIQNSTFELVNDNKVPLLVCNKDTGAASRQLITAIDKIGMFKLSQVVAGAQSEQEIQDRMHAKDALVAVIIPANFSAGINQKAKGIAAKALADVAVEADSAGLPPASQKLDSVVFYYHPVLQKSFRQSVEGALGSALQLVQSKAIVSNLYFSLNETEITDTLENEIANNQVPIKQLAVSRDGSRNIPNATQHNIPAWTVFAMFFVVISLGSSVVREKLSGSFVRLKTLPTSFMVAMVSKQLTYLLVTLLQTAVIFSFGVWLFPLMGLPKLDLPSDIVGLGIVSLICGWCAVSYAVCIGVFAQTQEQANGIGAVSVVLMAAIGGVLVPSFAMPAGMQVVMKMSPLHWCLEAYYGLFLEGGGLKDILINLLPLLIITVGIQILAYWGLKRKNFI